MNILFIHQNFPGQYKNLAAALAAQGHRCVALTLRVKKPTKWQGVDVLPYTIKRKQGGGTHPWLMDLDTKVIRAESCMIAAMDLKERGFSPDVIVAHPGWGEAMFLRDVWPKARIGLYYELFYQPSADDVGFDPEFPNPAGAFDPLRLRLKNLNNALHYPLGDMGISPTHFQAGTYPKKYQDRISVIHDGIDTEQAAPNPEATFKVSESLTLSCADEVVTFVNRNLEPYRGYHVFMRSLPKLLVERPKAHIVIVGGDGHSYGTAAPEGQTWKQIFIDEVRGQISDLDWARVHFVGKVPYDNFLNLLQIARVHVYLTYPFVLSWSLLEAMSIGAAIVASDTAPVREVIDHDRTGRLVDFFDQEGLASEIADLLNDERARHALGANARNLIVRNFDLKTKCLPMQLDWINQLAEMEPGGTEI
ncbi:glycosyltransferase family 4 protein [Cognatishimia activa]|uniref:GDP-mannose-dependent alpha-(1-2)-phosphatidylinositol mannosyltransferase n=1 Tax=Cognatishimia activa TaxID=1715691 RepID=A0A0P1IL98_9RHOB|nr:glycosyltransferase family 4 protein [Cognatishimia activa]CUI56821.1 GDP-mannose-dependent alpha-(1-2)-phosphatidylinositol mannosyltransferase [Cognatishimia activa]CUK24403.1 GDP-mannose-dependent alpha-(1-2)-phosphatidylinositol mannosyltransferase [Cognatishimia activa]